MRRFRSEWLRGAQPRGAGEVIGGDNLDIKFANALETELDPGEITHARLFQPPQVSRKRRLPGNLLVLTDRRLLWITDRENGFRSRYGSIASYAPIDGVSQVTRASDGLLVALPGGAGWRIRLASAYLRAGEELANLVTASIRSGANLI